MIVAKETVNPGKPQFSLDLFVIFYYNSITLLPYNMAIGITKNRFMYKATSFCLCLYPFWVPAQAHYKEWWYL